ncbi:unnamed protein product [Leptosia nina]|uniref:Lipase n=1 Tax=Leptosia nina TaxID=320188 RepID=A0AAV1J7H9_9NEOP
MPNIIRVLIQCSVVLLLITLPVNSSDNDVVCDTEGKIIRAGYPHEKFDVITEDGYILQVHRIPQGKNQNQTIYRPVVFLMHGLFASPSCYVELGSQYAIAFNLADEGFDVWLGSARGVCNSRRHQQMDPDDRIEKHKFFDYSWHEIGLYDLPAMIDFALKVSGQDKLFYIGHSQGGTTFLVLNSMKPEYNSKIKAAHLLAAVGYQKNFPNERMKRYALLTDPLVEVTKMFGIVELDSGFLSAAPKETEKTEDPSEVRVPISDLGTTAAVKQMAHYGQNVRDKTFRRWNYSLGENLLRYGSLTPPRYNLSLINVDITMHYTLGDVLLDENDVLDMVRDLPHAKARKLTRDSFTHYDFVQSSFVKSLVTDYVINDLKRR